MKICVLDEKDAKSYHVLRLSALKTNPEAFGSTYEREVRFSLDTVIERIKPTKDKFVLGAIDDLGVLVGIVTFMRDQSVKMFHKGYVFGMYVSPEVRGRSVGKSLLLELIRKAKTCEGLEQINLTVVSDNEPAKKLYESIGFNVYGVERNALKFNNKYYDENLMVLSI